MDFDEEQQQIKMKIWILIRNIFILIKVLQYFSFKVIFKSLFIWNRHMGHQFWAVECFSYFKVKLHEFKGHPIRQEKTMFLVNHRSQADFFVHNVVLKFKTNFLARLAVGIFMPVFGLFANDTVWFFNRSKNVNVEKFNEWLDKKFKNSPRPSLLVYPESHRLAGTAKVQKQKLKNGMARYAYRRKIPVQFVMTFGNEDIMNEKTLHFQWGKTVYYKISQVHDPAEFEDENDFVNAMRDRFCEFFDEVYELTEKQKAIDMKQE